MRIGRLIWMLLIVLDIEIPGHTLAVMRGYETAYGFGQSVLIGQFKTFLHMTGYDAGTLLRGQFVMRIDAVLVFGKEGGVVHLAYIVIKGCGTYQLGAGLDAGGSLGCQGGYLH